MYLQEKSIFGDEIFDRPVINWEEQEKYAIIAFLLLSLDKKADHEGKVRFDDLFGLNETGHEEGEEENTEAGAKQEARDAIIRECERFLDSLDENERYDAIADEIDRFIEGDNSRYSVCNIGGSYGTWGSANSGKLSGGINALWNMVRFAISGADYSASQKRLLKHLARKWDVEASMFPVLENAAKRFPEIARKRKELSESNLPHNEVLAILAGLDTEEAELWKHLKRHGVFADGTSVGDAQLLNLINLNRVLEGQEAISDINELETIAAKEKEEYREPTMSDRVGDAIVDGIYKVGDIICAPFEWMTDKLMGL